MALSLLDNVGEVAHPILAGSARTLDICRALKQCAVFCLRCCLEEGAAANTTPVETAGSVRAENDIFVKEIGTIRVLRARNDRVTSRSRRELPSCCTSACFHAFTIYRWWQSNGKRERESVRGELGWRVCRYPRSRLCHGHGRWHSYRCWGLRGRRCLGSDLRRRHRSWSADWDGRRSHHHQVEICVLAVAAASSRACERCQSTVATALVAFAPSLRNSDIPPAEGLARDDPPGIVRELESLNESLQSSFWSRRCFASSSMDEPRTRASTWPTTIAARAATK